MDDYQLLAAAIFALCVVAPATLAVARELLDERRRRRLVRDHHNQTYGITGRSQDFADQVADLVRCHRLARDLPENDNVRPFPGAAHRHHASQEHA